MRDIPTLKTVKALRGDELLIDLKKTFPGTLTAWMKKNPTDAVYRAFEIVDSRYLKLTTDKTVDYYDNDGKLVETIGGRWFFDVEQLLDGETISSTIYKGSILFENDITNSIAEESIDGEGLVLQLAGKENKNEKGEANGYAPLDADKKIPSEFLPPIGGAQSLAETLTIGGRGVRVIGTDSVLQLADRSKVLLCNNEDFYLSLISSVGTSGDEFIIVNPSNTTPPSIAITGSQKSIFYNGEEFTLGSSIPLPAGCEAHLYWLATNKYFLSIITSNSSTSQNFQQVTTGAGNNITTNPVIFKKNDNEFIALNSLTGAIEFWDLTISTTGPITVISKESFFMFDSENTSLQFTPNYFSCVAREVIDENTIESYGYTLDTTEISSWRNYLNFLGAVQKISLKFDRILFNYWNGSNIIQNTFILPQGEQESTKTIATEEYISTELEYKVDKIDGYGLSEQNFSTIDKDKLDSLSNYAGFRGAQSSLANIIIAYPEGALGDWAIITNPSGNAYFAIWDTDIPGWIEAGQSPTIPGTNLAYTIVDNTLTITSDTGNDVIIPLATSTTAGLQSKEDKSKLDSITAIFTTTLKSYYDSAYSWITTNGATILSHLSNFSNPHNTTATQVGAYTTAETDSLLANINVDAVDKVTVKLSENITKGQAVYISSANGTNIIVSKASNSSEATSSKTLGLLETTGVSNTIVRVVTNGLLSGLNTSSATIGDAVWLGTSGDLIFGLSNKPVAPSHLVYVGVVSRAHATQGEIIVKVQNGFELDELHDVLITSISDKQLLYHDSSVGLWKNGSISSILGFTPDKPLSILSLNADYAGSNSTAAQKAFNVGTSGGGSIPVLANKKYRMRLFLYIEGLSSTSGTLSVATLGSASIDTFFGPSLAKKSGNSSSPAGPQSTLINSAPQVVTSSTTTTTAYMFLDIDFTTLSAGSFIPSFIVSVSSSPVVKKGSWCTLQELGPASLTATPDIV